MVLETTLPEIAQIHPSTTVAQLKTTHNAMKQRGKIVKSRRLPYFQLTTTLRMFMQLFTTTTSSQRDALIESAFHVLINHMTMEDQMKFLREHATNKDPIVLSYLKSKDHLFYLNEQNKPECFVRTKRNTWKVDPCPRMTSVPIPVDSKQGLLFLVRNTDQVISKLYHPTSFKRGARFTTLKPTKRRTDIALQMIEHVEKKTGMTWKDKRIVSMLQLDAELAILIELLYSLAGKYLSIFQSYQFTQSILNK